MEKPSLSQTKTIMNKSESSIENLYLFSKISVVFICKWRILAAAYKTKWKILKKFILFYNCVSILFLWLTIYRMSSLCKWKNGCTCSSWCIPITLDNNIKQRKHKVLMNKIPSKFKQCKIDCPNSKWSNWKKNILHFSRSCSACSEQMVWNFKSFSLDEYDNNEIILCYYIQPIEKFIQPVVC
jgi:hypothetical protein